MKALQANDDDGVRIKLAVMTPPVFTSLDDLQARYKDMLTAFKKLLSRPNLKLKRDAQVKISFFVDIFAA